MKAAVAEEAGIMLARLGRGERQILVRAFEEELRRQGFRCNDEYKLGTALNRLIRDTVQPEVRLCRERLQAARKEDE